ncbi:MAG: hypothetical protein WAV68_03025 [Candidatus Nanogingivalis sp.]
MCIFVKTVNAVLPNGLPALTENISASRISGEKAKEVLGNIGRILDGENEYVREASAEIFSEDLITLEKIFDIFESEGIDDSAPYYRIWKDEWCEGESFEIYCQPGKKLRIVKIPPEKP